MSAPPVRQFVRSSTAMTILYIGSTGLSFVVGIVLARLLGAAQYGTYALALTSATLAGLVAEFGLPMLAMRETGRARTDGAWGMLKGLLRWSDRVILTSSALLAVTCWAVIAFIGDGASAYLRALAWGTLLVPAVAIGKLRSTVLLAFDRVYVSQVPVMIGRPVLFLLGCLIGRWFVGRLDAPFAMALQAFAAAVVAAGTALLFRRYRPTGFAQSARLDAVREWVATCVPMGLSEALRLLQGQLAMLMIGALASSAAAGVYRVADAAAQVTIIVWSIVGTATAPLFARLHGEGDRDGLDAIALLAAWTMVAGAITVGLPIMLCGRWLFRDVFGPEFAASLPLFEILWLGVLAAATCGLPLAIANMTGHHVLATQSFLIIVALNGMVGAALIPSLGARGGAIASATALAAGTAYGALRLYRATGINATVFTRRSAHLLGGAMRAAAAWRAAHG